MDRFENDLLGLSLSKNVFTVELPKIEYFHEPV